MAGDPDQDHNAAGRDDTPPEMDETGPDPLRFSNWMKRSATGVVLSGVVRGLQQALEPKRQEIGFVVEADEPDDPEGPLTLRFDPDDPTATVAVVREQGADRRRARDGLEGAPRRLGHD